MGKYFNWCWFQNKPQLVDPLDFENFLIKNKTVLQNDPQRELLLYPADDIQVGFSIWLFNEVTQVVLSASGGAETTQNLVVAEPVVRRNGTV